MPALNIEFTEDELAIVREASANAGLSLRAYSKRAILDGADERAARAHRIGARLAEQFAELNQRLA